MGYRKPRLSNVFLNLSLVIYGIFVVYMIWALYAPRK